MTKKKARKILERRFAKVIAKEMLRMSEKEDSRLTLARDVVVGWGSRHLYAIAGRAVVNVFVAAAEGEQLHSYHGDL